MLYSTDSTRRHPRTTLEAFPDDRAAWACALERPRPAPIDVDRLVGWACVLGLLGLATVDAWGWIMVRTCQ